MSLFKKIKTNGFFHATAWSGIATLIRVAIHFLLNKMMAVYVGTAGMGILGQLRSFVMLSEGITGAAIGSGVSKLLSEFNHDKTKKTNLLHTAFGLSIISGFLMGSTFFLFAKEISILLFKTPSYSFVIYTLSGSITFYSLKDLFIHILYGLKAVKKSAWVNISGALSSFLIVGSLTYIYGLKGALIGFVLFQIPILGIAFILTVKCKDISIRDFWGKIDFSEWKALLKYIPLSFILIFTYIEEVIIRRYLMDTLSIESAGIWEALLRLMLPFSVLVGMIVKTYYMPKLAGLKDKSLLIKEIKQSYLLLFPLLTLSFTLLFFIKEWLIPILFTAEFSMVNDLLPYYLVGELFRFLGWLSTYLLIAKGRIKVLSISETISICSYLGLLFWLTPVFGIYAIGYIHIIHNILYFLYISWQGIYVLRSISNE